MTAPVKNSVGTPIPTPNANKKIGKPCASEGRTQMIVDGNRSQAVTEIRCEKRAGLTWRFIAAYFGN